MALSAQSIVDRAAAGLARRTGRRSFLIRSAVVGSALAASGMDYVLRPGTAYASVCGSGASCGDGWTAMCCTVHRGVNQCPPGSFAGGWWKADGASLCGGKARYYIDCQAECTHCRCRGGSFCPQHCWNCHPHCGDGDCDKRRVCHNVFRYGQCERDRGCSGPVLCRTISCTPPWEWLSCSRASATDQATVSHSASCLSPWGPILERYTRMGSQGSVLGASVGHERQHGRARVQDYLHGRMYHAGAVGAHWLSGPVLDKYEHLHQGQRRLGLPTSDLIHRGADSHAWFQTGAVTHRHGEPAHAIWKKVAHKWRSLDGIAGPLGWPASDNQVAGDGTVWARFTAGTVTRRTHDAPHAVWGVIETKWRSLQAQSGVLGWPASDVVPTVDEGTLARFASGSVAASESTGVHAVWGPIDTAWWQHRGANGSLGLPVTDVYQNADGDQQADFTGGSIVYDPQTGQTTILPPPPGPASSGGGHRTGR